MCLQLYFKKIKYLNNTQQNQVKLQKLKCIVLLIKWFFYRSAPSAIKYFFQRKQNWFLQRRVEWKNMFYNSFLGKQYFLQDGISSLNDVYGNFKIDTVPFFKKLIVYIKRYFKFNIKLAFMSICVDLNFILARTFHMVVV